MSRLLLVLALGLGLGSTARADAVRLFSYDPADAETRAATGPVTLQFRQGLIHVTIMNLRSTEAQATTDLVKAPDSAVGPGGLAPVLGKTEAWRDLYRVSAEDQGPAFIHALCQTSNGWLAIGRPRYGQSLAVYVIGAEPDGPAKLCRTLNYTFRGEWRAPRSGSFDERLLDHDRQGPL